MFKRMILMLALTAVVIGGLGAVKFQQIQAAVGQAAAFQPPPEAVTTIVASAEPWPDTLPVIGTDRRGAGRHRQRRPARAWSARIAFESGRAVREGDVLVELDTRQEQAQLAAAEAQRELARLNFERMQALVVDGAISKADFDQAAAEQKSTDARVGEIKASIARKTIRAPFSGILGIRQVNLGQYLSGGDPVVPLQSLHPIYVNFGVPQQDTARVHVGGAVRITADELSGTTLTRPRHGRRLGRQPGDAQRPGAGDGRRTPTASCGRACSCRRRSPPAPRDRSCRCRHRRSATRRSATRSTSSAI